MLQFPWGKRSLGGAGQCGMSENSRSLCLYMAGSAGEDKRFALRSGDTIIGRESTSEIVLSDPSISRRHAKITVTQDQVTIKDGVEEKSSNGVYLNNNRVLGEAAMREGDVLKIGVFRFELLRLSEDESPISITQVSGVDDLALYLKKNEISPGDEEDIVAAATKIGLTEKMARQIFDDALDMAMRRNELRKVAVLSKIKLDILENLWSGGVGATHNGTGETKGERDVSSKAIIIALVIAAAVLVIVSLSNIML